MTSFDRRAAALAVIATLSCAGCRRESWGGPGQLAPAPSGTNPPPGVGAGAVAASDPGAAPASGGGGGNVAAMPANAAGPQAVAGRPRILLDAPHLAALRRVAQIGGPSWKTLTRRCQEGAEQHIDSGYEAWEWGDVMVSCALRYQIAGNTADAQTALLYFKAMLDDRKKVGDAKGGDDVVHHDSGYPIRTYGMLTAIAYDWLHDAPGMTGELRKRAVDRFVAWTTWYKDKGYKHEAPIANYYAGYFGTVGLGGIAAAGDDPRAGELRRTAQQMFRHDILPAFKKLDGGQWPEGWQYGGAVAATLAAYTQAEGLQAELPWLRDIVAYRTQALWPDGVHIYDNGDWGFKPATAGGAEMWALTAALPQTDPVERQARALARLVKEDRSTTWRWLEALAGDPSQPADDPRKAPTPTSYIARGTGNVFARTDWSPNATWFSLQAGPFLSDHQHIDQGHFEIVRGGDPLLVDGGGYGAASTMSHNTILVDDNGDALTYSPNQVPVESGPTIARFEDAGAQVYALADISKAYLRSTFKEDGKRSVLRVEREAIFARSTPPRVVIYDRVTVTKPTYAVTWTGHTYANAQIDGPITTVTSGRSAAQIATLVPAGSIATTVQEPTSKNKDSFWLNNDPPENTKSTRIEVASPKGQVERRFLHAISVLGAGEKGAPAARIAGEGVEGAAIADQAYVFPVAKPFDAPAAISYRAPIAATRHVIVGLAPEGHYAVTGTRDGDACKIAFTPGGGIAATKAGVVTLDVRACAATAAR